MVAMLLDNLSLPKHLGNQQIWGNASHGATALALAEHSLLFPGLSLIITEDSASANRLQRELDFFTSRHEKTPHSRLEQLHFPDWETLPYDYFSPHQDIISERFFTLSRLPHVQHGILIVSVTTLMHRLMPVDQLISHSLVLQVGMALNSENYVKKLLRAGYLRTDTVIAHGQFATRGSIIDLFPMGSSEPYRLDLFDNTLDGLRTFNPETQCSTSKQNEIHLLPAREYLLTPEKINHFKQSFQDIFDINLKNCPIYKDISAGIPSPGAEYYLPLFFDQTATLFDYIPENTMVFKIGDIQSAATHFWKECQLRYENHCANPERPILPPSRLFLDLPSLNRATKHFSEVVITVKLQQKKQGHENFVMQLLPTLTIEHKKIDPIQKLREFIIQSNARILLVAESAGRSEQLLELFNRFNLQPDLCTSWHHFLSGNSQLAITIAQTDSPLWLPLSTIQHASKDIVIITEHQLFDSQVMQRRRRGKTSENFTNNLIRNLTELKEGSPVVHIEQGVGRYLGLQTIASGDYPQEFLVLQYAKEAKLYIPVSSLHLISRYTGASEELAPLHRLGNEQWSNARKKAEEKARDVAVELLDIYAQRAARSRQPFEFDAPDYMAFANEFPFEETPDQNSAIEAVLQDMQKEQPMDRLVCGDVGFGKTEVAMRAAFMAVTNGRQVVLLAPTTLLSQQHLNSFRNRFAGWPFTVEVISRFRSAKDIETIINQIASGTIDIIIGTHKLLSSSIIFKNLGLIIIDEEHRFGVRQKEKLKSLRAETDILALTATPIPRTLNIALSGIRDLSIIATPPARRLSIKTFVRPFNKALIKEAIQRELLRGGQVYYLHNDVKTIEKAAAELEELIPEARIAIGHGQLRERALEQIMQSFYHKHYNVLVCTTIIETGIDIPSANTIIINRADKLGLAQLHQLRGRVGRSHHQAYAYLLPPPDIKSISIDAVKRLEAIEQADTLGAGFMLASHDLEIRGAGEFLGEEQSGQIQTIGFTLYTELLEKAVNSMKQTENGIKNTTDSLFSETEINLQLPALLPDKYIKDVHSRLVLYKRIASANNNHQLRELQVELIDRFGLLPEATKNLFRLMELKIKAAPLSIKRIEFGPNGGRLEFDPSTTVDPVTLVFLVQNQPELFTLESQSMTLKYKGKLESVEQRFNFLDELLNKLTSS